MESWDGKFAGAWTLRGSRGSLHFTSLSLLPSRADWCVYTNTVLETFLQQFYHMNRSVLFFCLNPRYFRHLILGRDLLYPTTARVQCGDASSKRSYSHGISGVYEH
jgi:hypothetical protein